MLIDGGVISAVGPGLEVPADALVLDAAGRMVMPGGIDVATNFHVPKGGIGQADDFSSGTRSALAGGGPAP